MKYSIHSARQSLPADATRVHLVRPVSAKKLTEWMQKRSLKEITLSANCFKRLNPKAKTFAEGKGIVLRVESSRGRPLELKKNQIREIASLFRDEVSLREIEKKTGIPKSTAHYLVKYAGRKKMRERGGIVYLK
ncbi:MAG: hypothetical protein HY917_02340 [Candidatus Diapherotrites archaeon]|nr:hypothetical protein [Candidatus Diapherotrites archaeon]